MPGKGAYLPPPHHTHTPPPPRIHTHTHAIFAIPSDAVSAQLFTGVRCAVCFTQQSEVMCVSEIAGQGPEGCAALGVLTDGQCDIPNCCGRRAANQFRVGSTWMYVHVLIVLHVA